MFAPASHGPRIFPRRAAAWLLLLLALVTPSGLAQSKPLLRVQVGDVHPVVARLLESDAVAALARDPAVQALLGDRSGAPAVLWQALANWIPTRIDVVVPQSAAPAIDGLFTLGVADQAFRAMKELPTEQQAAVRDRLEQSLVETMRALPTLEVDLDLELRAEAAAQQSFRRISDALLDRLDEDGLGDLDGITVTEDEGSVTIAVGFAAMLEELRSFEAPALDDRLLARLAAASHDEVLALRIVQDGRRLRASLGRADAVAAGTPEPAAAAADPDDAPLLSASWHLDDARDVYARMAALQRFVCQSPIGERLPAVRADLATTNLALDEMRAGPLAGQLSVAVTDDALRMQTVTENVSSPATLQEVGLLDRVPDDMDLFAAGTSLLPDACLTATVSMLERLQRGDRLHLDAKQLELIRRPLLQLCQDLDAARDRFDPGWVLLAGAPKEWTQGTERDLPRLVPSFALLGRPKTTDAGMWLARNVLTPIAAATGSTIEPGDGELSVEESESSWKLAPGWQPHAFVSDGVLVISTSRQLDERIEQARGHHQASEQTCYLLRTTGRRLAALVARVAELASAVVVRAGGTAETATGFSGVGSFVSRALALLGNVEGTVRQVDHRQEGIFVVQLAPSADELANVLARARHAYGDPLPEDRMLVARGDGMYGGAPVDVELSYAADGRFREELRGPLGADVAWNGTVLLQDLGWGRLPVDTTFSDDGMRSWAAAVSGQWLDPRSGIAARLLEQNEEGITLELQGGDGMAFARLVLDPTTFAARRIEQFGDRHATGEVPFVLSDPREAAGRTLAHHIESGNGATVYDLEWTLEPLDEARFSPGASPQARLADDAHDDVTIHAVDDDLWVEGSVGGEKGWFGLLPLVDKAGLTDGVFDKLVSNGAPHTENRLLANNVVAGPLRAEQGVFERTPLPSDQNGRHVLGFLGTPILQGCCVRFDFGGPSLTIEPGHAVTEEDAGTMTEGYRHRVFTCTLRGGTSSWWSPIAMQTALVLISEAEVDRLKGLATGSKSALDEHGLPWLEAGSMVLRPPKTYVFGALSAWAEDPCPIVITNAVLGDAVFEMDFPHQRYRLLRD